MNKVSVCRAYSNTPAQHTTIQLEKTKGLRILIDWLGFTVSNDSWSLDLLLEYFQKTLNISKTFWKEGRRNYEGYAQSLVFENINVYYNGAENQGLHVDITGQGCRFLDTIYQKLGIQSQKLPIQADNFHRSWHDLFDDLRNYDLKFTRIDIACDDFLGFFTASHIFNKCLAGEVTSKFKNWRPDGKWNMDGETNGITVYFGSPQSRISCTFYEKNKQLNLPFHWTRTELRFKHERAESLVDLILQENPQYDLGYIFAGVLKDYITFRDASDKDSNKWRWDTSIFWNNFLAAIPRLQLSNAPPDRSIEKRRGWIDKQVSKSIACLVLAYEGYDNQWLRDVFEDGAKKLTSEDYKMIEEFRRLHGLDLDYYLPKNVDDEKNGKKNTRQKT